MTTYTKIVSGAPVRVEAKLRDVVYTRPPDNDYDTPVVIEAACADVYAKAQETDMPASADERKLRRMYAWRVGMPGLYEDDGEASGSEHGISIDFMREPVADIAAKVMALEVARRECQKTPSGG